MFSKSDLAILLMFHLQIEVPHCKTIALEDSVLSYCWQGVLVLLSNEAIVPSARNTPVSWLVQSCGCGRKERMSVHRILRTQESVANVIEKFREHVHEYSHENM